MEKCIICSEEIKYPELEVKDVCVGCKIIKIEEI